MVEGLGGTVRPVEAVFDPEGGAYGGHSHGHDHHHDHD
jgi:urease accessory protein